MAERFIVRFTETAPLALVGGKGLNLMRLMGFGMPVPAGFVVSTDAYDAVVARCRLGPLLAEAARRAADDGARAELSAGIASAFTSAPLPADLAEAIAAGYRSLAGENGAVAVRSSATAEDLAEASFAGQQDTYLNVTGVHDVLDAVRRCFASLWSERAIAYRARVGFEPLAARLAVVIQLMVPAAVAGVVFTADPVSGDSGLVVIDMVRGLGESLVSGLATPDHLVLDKETGAIVSCAVATRHSRPVLDRKQVRALWRLARAVEDAYGTPQDIEWCWARGAFSLVQARAITTLPEIPVTWRAPGPGRWMHGGGTLEMITEPVSPLFETFLLPILVRAISGMVEDLGLAGAMPADPYRVINGYIFLHMAMRFRPRHLFGIVKDFAMHFGSMKDQDTEQATYREAVAALRGDASTLADEVILARMTALGEAGMRYWLQITKVVQAIYRHEEAFRTFYARVRQAGDPDAEILLRGQEVAPWVAECATYELARRARALGLRGSLAQTADEPLGAESADPALSAWHADLAKHLERFGHQISSFDLAQPTLADSPGPVLCAVQAFLDGVTPPQERRARMVAERDAAIARVTARLSRRRQARFAVRLRTAQRAARVREDALFDVGLAWTPMRRCALELGARLARGGVIEAAEDVFWLTLTELREALSAPVPRAEVVARRRRERRSWSAVKPPFLLPYGSKPAVWWSAVFPTPELRRHPDARTLVGLGVSPGTVTGVARVVVTLDEMGSIEPGDILVTRSTTPAWTPLFSRISALVTDLGGPLAHGSIVAREVGIPAVMGTGTATTRIRSGQTITVLGSEGKVLLG